MVNRCTGEGPEDLIGASGGGGGVPDWCDVVVDVLLGRPASTGEVTRPLVKGGLPKRVWVVTAVARTGCAAIVGSSVSPISASLAQADARMF